jgi:2-polyprenyl-3-methyl-5-hydroxy-6-metoxy-1,4-benzoquinol methylase
VDAKCCKICGERARYLCSTRDEHGRAAAIQHFRCDGCGLVFVGNDLRSSDLGEAYGAVDFDTYYDEIRDENRKKFVTAAEALEWLLPDKSRRVLDIGTGNGEFLEMLSSRGFGALSAHEIPGSNLEHLKAKGVATYQDYDYAALPAAAFDAITMLDVAEHVLDPCHLFASCFRALRPGGLVYFHTPVVTRVDRAMHYVQRVPVLGKAGRMWQRGRTSIYHLQNYTDRALQLVLGQAGYEQIAIARKNELSWPVERYVRVYLLDKQHLPAALAPWLTPVFAPLLASAFFNANKGVVRAYKPLS